MKKLILLTILLFTSCSALKIQDESIPINKGINTAVVIYNDLETGSGVIIDSNEKVSTILTNAHVCTIYNSNSTINVSRMIDMNKVYSGTIIKTSLSIKDDTGIFGIDLCLLRIKKGNLPSVQIVLKTPPIGTPVFNVSSPHGFTGYINKGYIGETSLDPDRVRTSLLVFPGSSGSGVFNFRGHLVGLVVENYIDTAISRMIPAESIIKFLKKD